MSKRLVENMKFVEGLPSAVPSTSVPDYVSMKDASHLTIIINVKNATTVTGSAITVKQATAVAGTNEKALSFASYWANLDTAATDTLVKTTATSDTFTTLTTNSKNQMYVIEIPVEDLDVAGGFDCVRAGTGDATAATVTVNYILSGMRHANAIALPTITD